MTSAREHEFEQFVRENRLRLVRSATTMTGGDAHLAEDLVQTALVRTYLAWNRTRTRNPYAYVRRAVVNGLIDHKRRPVTRREYSADELPDRAEGDLGRSTADPALLTALAHLPVGMRAAVVLRHVEGLSVEETADAMSCSTGTVKSQTARGLDRLRELMSDTGSDTPTTSTTTSTGDTPCQI